MIANKCSVIINAFLLALLFENYHIYGNQLSGNFMKYIDRIKYDINLGIKFSDCIIIEKEKYTLPRLVYNDPVHTTINHYYVIKDNKFIDVGKNFNDVYLYFSNIDITPKYHLKVFFNNVKIKHPITNKYVLYKNIKIRYDDKRKSNETVNQSITIKSSENILHDSRTKMQNHLLIDRKLYNIEFLDDETKNNDKQILFNDGRKYIGECNQGKPNGKGKCFYPFPNKRVYTGDWINGLRIGQGTIIWGDGAVYIGKWENNKRHGQGKMIWNNGQEYIGEWHHDKRHGKGKMTNLNGDVYIGEWENGEMHGKGILTKSDGSIQKGLWVKGEYQNTPI